MWSLRYAAFFNPHILSTGSKLLVEAVQHPGWLKHVNVETLIAHYFEPGQIVFPRSIVSLQIENSGLQEVPLELKQLRPQNIGLSTPRRVLRRSNTNCFNAPWSFGTGGSVNMPHDSVR